MKKIELKNWQLIFIEMFNVWQMGVIFYSAKSLAINNLVNTPIEITNSIITIFIGYIFGILAMYFIPKKTILISRISVIISLISCIVLLFPIPSIIFLSAYHIMLFCCVLFISLYGSLAVNYYSVGTALKEGYLSTLVSGIGIAILQNQFIPFSFNMFLISSIICLILMGIMLFSISNKNKLVLADKKISNKKITVGLVMFTSMTCLNTLFTSSIAGNITNGVSIAYIGSIASALIFIYFYKKNPDSIFNIIISILIITSLGFLIYLIPNYYIKIFAIFLQGFSYLLIMIQVLFYNILFKKYKSRILVPLYIFTAFITVIVNTIILEVFRNDSQTLYIVYTIISIFIIIIYLSLEKYFELEFLIPNENYDKLTLREQEVIELLIDGLTSKEIADKLFISEHTAKEHIKNIYKKYEVNTKQKLIKKISENRKK